MAVAASEFGFLGGSIGVAAGERLARAVERATAERLPLIALPASGGTRMQEGTVAFLQMVKITTAVTAHKAARLPYIVYLRHPTTGGVFASWASLGHLTLAEPGALIGFLGPRVYQALHGAPFPGGVQTAANLHAHGLVDAVVSPADLAATSDRVLTAMTAQPRPVPPQETAGDPAGLGCEPAWESIEHTREPGYPGAADLIRAAATDVVPLHGAGRGRLILALARIGGYPCVLAGQDRHGPPPGPAALRVTRRGIHLAAGLRLPLVTVIDTPGAELSPEAEEDGLASEIAYCLADLMRTGAPTVSRTARAGHGRRGAGPAARRPHPGRRARLAGAAGPRGGQRHRLPRHRHAPELAARQGVRATDLAALGIIDRVIPEAPGGASAGSSGRRCAGPW